MVLLPHPAQLRTFCVKWYVAQLWLFGSVARGTERTNSDVDLLVEFFPGSPTSTWDWPEMTDELTLIFGIDVHLVSAGILKNRFRRDSILASRKLLYAA